jgi:hypothetical protein
MNNQEIYEMVTNMRSNMLVFNDNVYYVSYDIDTNELFAGTATNGGTSKDYTVYYDPDMSLDYNLEGLVDLMLEDECNWEIDSEIDVDNDLIDL